MADALLTDLYELNMVASYLRRDLTGPATFSLFVRDLPGDRGFLVAAGLADCLDVLETLAFSDAGLAYLEERRFDRETRERFAALRFTGSVRAVPEGRIVTAGEPLLEVTAPLPEAQLVESILLNAVTFPTAVATTAARYRLAAADRVELIEFGFRRTHGVGAGLTAARASGIVGFAGTSNVEAARRFGLRPAGTMAHSYVQAFPSELDAFRAIGADLPDRVTFLVDTYDVAVGLARAIEVIDGEGLGQRAGVRLDSGDLADGSRMARRMLDEAGLDDVTIFVSGGIGEVDLAELVAADAPIDSAGIGTRLGVSADAPYLDSVYKMVDVGGRPVAKLSAAKATLPGAKQVFRAPGLDDRLGLAGEPAPPGSDPLLEVVMAGGRRTAPDRGPAAAVADARARFAADLAELPRAARRLRSPVPLRAQPTPALRRLTDTVHDALSRSGGGH